MTTDPLGHTTKATFDADGNKTSTTDGDNNTTATAYDAAYRPTTTTRADTSTITTTYNGDGTTATVKDAAGNVTTYGYDGQGRRITATNPDSRVTTTGYDPAGHVVTVKDPAGATTTYTVDGAGQVTAITYSDGVTPNVSATRYDPDGRPTSMIDGTGTSTWSYDTFGDLTSSLNGAGPSMAYGYDARGYTDSETPLIYLQARYYDPATGQFLTIDAAVAATGAPYGYVNGNYANLIDPLGLWGSSPIADIGEAVQWAWKHPVTAGGIVLAAVSMVTGASERAGAAFAIGDLVVSSEALGAISFATGAIGSGMDYNDCVNGGNRGACVGLVMGVPGLVTGVGGLIGISSAWTSGFAFVTGAMGAGWDTANSTLGGETGQSTETVPSTKRRETGQPNNSGGC